MVIAQFLSAIEQPPSAPIAGYRSPNRSVPMEMAWNRAPILYVVISLLLLTSLAAGLGFFSGYAKGYQDGLARRNLTAADDIIDQGGTLGPTFFSVPYPPATPYDRDPEKKKWYLIYFKLGYETVWGVEAKCPPSEERSPLHVVRGWRDGTSAGLATLKKQTETATERMNDR
jgi:hypothetical protein